MTWDVIEIIPDTNIFLEFEFFTDVDWPRIAGARTVRLLVTLPVLNELDEHRLGSNQRRRERAIQVLTRIRDLTQNFSVESTVRPDVTISLLPLRARSDDFGVDLDPTWRDDHLLIITQRWQQQSTVPVQLMTRDTAMQAKAQLLLVPVLVMPDDLRRPPEPSREAVRLRRLAEELEALKAELPKPVLRFHVSNQLTDRTHLALEIPRAPTKEDFAQQVGNLAKRLQEIVTTLRSGQHTGGLF